MAEAEVEQKLNEYYYYVSVSQSVHVSCYYYTVQLTESSAVALAQRLTHDIIFSAQTLTSVPAGKLLSGCVWPGRSKYGYVGII